MRGFTLLEILIYISISSLILIQLFQLSFTLHDSMIHTANDSQIEIEGNLVLKEIEQQINSNSPIYVGSTTIPITKLNIIQENSTSTNLKKIQITFSIQNHDFSLICFIPHEN
jgi:Tfp pilus assembly protein PilW